MKNFRKSIVSVGQQRRKSSLLLSQLIESELNSIKLGGYSFCHIRYYISCSHCYCIDFKGLIYSILIFLSEFMEKKVHHRSSGVLSLRIDSSHSNL